MASSIAEPNGGSQRRAAPRGAFAPGVQEPQAPVRPGRRPASFYRLAVGSAILHLHDRASLECNALAQLAGVRRLADERYPGKIWRRGLCLRDLLTEAIDDTIEAADGDDLATLRIVISRAAAGNTLTTIAAELGIRRESLSKGLWSRITALVWERLKPRLLALED
ncbi:MAG: hypothetical protein Q8P22_13525 [Chloroflexota bacterium]|nr:hypothetical protein [Chloroflexota bacterium]